MYATPVTFDTSGGLVGTTSSGTYKAVTQPQQLSWNVQDVRGCQVVFSLMQSDMQRAFDYERPAIAERVASDWRALVSKMEQAGVINYVEVQSLGLQLDAVLRRGYEQLGTKLPVESGTKTPETAQQPGVIYTPPVQTIPREMVEPPPMPVQQVVQPTPSRTVTVDVVQQIPPTLPSGPGGGIVHAAPAAGFPWKWLLIGAGIAALILKGKK